jgi:exodeoxyribonuclease VII large subunit
VDIEAKQQIEDEHGIPQHAISSVKEVAERIDQSFQRSALDAVHVVGEVSNTNEWKGNHFFSLTESSAKIQCVLFGRHVDAYTPEEGDRVLARGSIDFYHDGGKLTLQANRLIPIGRGEYHRKLRERKTELREDGVFEREQELPRLPETVGIVTAMDSDAFHDIRNSIRHSAPSIDIIVADTSVQGDEAEKEVIQAIERLQDTAADAIVIGRGGGDIEALHPFNTREIAEAIYDCKLPVITGIGHREDETIAGLTADQRAMTPTDAGQQIGTGHQERLQEIQNMRDHLKSSFQRYKKTKEQQEAIRRKERREKIYITTISILILLLAMAAGHVIL